MKKIMQRILIICFTFCVFFYSSTVLSQSDNDKVPLKTAWEPWFPYEYLKIPSLQSSLTGLDVELLKLIAANANHPLLFKKASWDETLLSLKRGDIDLASGATYSDERAQYVYFSKPYRYEENSLLVLRAANKNYQFKTVDGLIEYIKKYHFHLGVNKDFLIADAKMNEFLADPNNAKYLIQLEDESDGLRLLLDNKIDGFLADRIVGSTIVWQAKADDIVSERYLNMKTNIHLIFSKKTVSEKVVQDFDQAIENVRNSTAYRNDLSWYIYPVVMLQETGKNWFKSLDVLGTIFFSISGVLIAYSLNKSFLAALIYAMLPSMTGGILRDVIYNNRPVEALKTPQFLLLIFSVVFVGYCIALLFNKIMQHEKVIRNARTITNIFSFSHKILKQLLVICDALGLATLTVSGVMISLMARAEPLWLWGPFFAFLTASLGTIIRDIISKNERLEDVVGELYSEIGIVWGLFLSLALIANANNIQSDLVCHLIVMTVAGVFVTRLLVYYFKVPNVYFK